MELKDKKILLVEDDTFIGQMLVRRLIAAKADVDWAKNGQEGLDVVNNGNYDIIVTDLMMANMDGYEMIKQIQSNEKTKDIPVIVLTNKESMSDDPSRVKELTIKARLLESTHDLSDIVKAIAKVLEKNKKIN